jgi:hypothetical protein
MPRTIDVDARDLNLGADALAALMDKLDGGAHDLADPYAEAVLDAARSAASGRPTPQARMAASGLQADHGSILAPAGVLVSGRGGRPASLQDLILGAEFGSSTYAQFGPRNSRGYWLWPAADSGDAMDAADRAMDEILHSVMR